jgi:hypothetical protein
MNKKTYNDFFNTCHATIVSPPLDCSNLPLTRAGQHLVREHRVHPAVADLLASMAGLGEQRQNSGGV